MGQTLRSISNNFNAKNSPKICNKLPDLASWPPELSLNVLKNLNATDLCLAACVWNELARDELLWQALCLSEWPYTSVYDRQEKPPDFSYHKLYLTLDEATITFNADYQLGMNYLFKYELINNDPEEIAKLFFHSKPFDRSQVRNYLKTNLDVLQHLINLFDFSDQTLPTALRQYFTILVPDRYDSYLHKLVEKFSIRYLQCNQMNRHNSPESIYVLCFALMLLSTDLLNPQIKNKMSKREFIRNIRHALSVSDDEYYGHLYDDVYLNGHIVGGTCKSSNGNNKSHHSNLLGKRFNMIL